MKQAQPTKSNETIYKVVFCHFAKPTYLAGTYNKTADKIPVGYQVDKPNAKSGIDLVIWEDHFIRVFGKNGKVSIVPVVNIVSMEIEELSNQERETFKHLV